MKEISGVGAQTHIHASYGNTSFIMKVECPAVKNHYILGQD